MQLLPSIMGSDCCVRLEMIPFIKKNYCKRSVGFVC
jgi:hypothetical protein